MSPIDSSIPLQVRGVEVPDPLETMAKITGIRTAQQRQQMQQMEIEGAQGAAQVGQRLRAVLSGPRPPTQEEIFSTGVDPAAGLEILKLISAGQAQNFKTEAEMRQSAAQFFGSLPALPDDKLRQEAYVGGREKYINLGIPAAELPEQYDPSVSDRFLRSRMTPEKQWDIAHPPAPSDYTMGRQRFSGTTNQPVATAEPEPPKPAAVGSEEDYLQRYAAQRRLKVEQLSPGDVNQARSQYAAAGRGPASTINISTAQQGVEAPADPDSQDIMAHAGLSYNGFLAATGRMSQLSRDQVTRNRASAEVAAWARSRGMDVATLASQYKAYNETLESNIERYNRTVLAEGEIGADIDNLLTAVKTSGLGDARAVNAAKQWLKGELNDPNAAEYAFYLNQLTNDIALYNAASQGRAALQSDMEEAKGVVQRGVATGSLTGLQTAITKSVEKMGVVLEAAVNRSRKNVWDLFGVGDKYKSTTRSRGRGAEQAPAARTPSPVAPPTGNPFR